MCTARRSIVLVDYEMCDEILRISILASSRSLPQCNFPQTHRSELTNDLPPGQQLSLNRSILA